MEKKLLDKIANALTVKSDVLAAYIIGSVGKRRARSDSDFDLVVVVDKKHPGVEDKTYNLVGGISFPKNLDLSIVDKTAPPLFLFQVVSNGEKVYIRKNSELARFEAFVLHNYYDNAHIRNIYASYLPQKFSYAN